jgi:hypothetical protein
MTSSQKPKIIHTELKDSLSERFDIIKANLGIQNDAEVIRFLIQKYYNDNLNEMEIIAQKEYEKDRTKIDKFMNKYGEEWQKLGEDDK